MDQTEQTTHPSVRHARAARVAELIDLEASSAGLSWGPEDLAAILRHRLETHTGLGRAGSSSSGTSGSSGSSATSEPEGPGSGPSGREGHVTLGELLGEERP